MAKKNLQFRGFEELAQVFDALPGRLGAKTVQGILRKAVKPIVEEAKAKVPKRTGNLKKSIGTIAGRGQGKGTQVYAGPRRGGPYKGYAGHLIEYGTGPRKQASTGRNTGSVAAQPFMRPAFDKMYPVAVGIVKAETRAIVESAFKNIKF